MPMTLTGSFNRRNIMAGDGYETVTSGYLGYDSSGYEEYRIYYEPANGDAFDTTETALELRIRLTLKKRTNETSGASILVHNYTRALQGTNELIDAGEWYTRISSYSSGANAVYTADGTSEQEVVYSTTDTALISRILSFGIGLTASSDLFQVTACVLELDVSSASTPPVISLNNGYGKIIDGKYWHYPWNEFTLSVNYEQEMDNPLWQVRLEYTAYGGEVTQTFTSSDGSSYVTVPTGYWKGLPNAGTLKITAYSDAGAASNVIEMPFEVALYTVSFTSHTSGSIIQSDADAVITWEAAAPTTPSGLVMSQEPTKYVRWIWWDDEEPTSGTYMTGTTYTISADVLAGHSVLHMAVPEVYGDGTYGLSQREREAAAVLNLYIQQVAGTGEVTISPLDSNGGIYNQFTVSWTSAAQAAYQVQVGDIYDSGIVWGSATSHKVQRFFGFGVYQAVIYPVRIRIQGTDGVWTDWTEPINLTRSGWTYNNDMPGLTAAAADSGVIVRLDTSIYNGGDPTRLLIYRNGIQIAQLLPNGGTVEYLDRNANGKTEYTAYLIPEHEWEDGGTCWGFAPVTVDAAPTTDGLFLPDNTWVPLRYTASAPRQYRTNVSEETHAKYYAGRTYPVFMRSGRKTKEFTMSYAAVGNELADLLEEAAGEMVIYKNRLGQVIHGELNQVSAVRGRLACEVSFTVTQADYTDEIPYTW